MDFIIGELKMANDDLENVFRPITRQKLIERYGGKEAYANFIGLHTNFSWFEDSDAVIELTDKLAEQLDIFVDFVKRSKEKEEIFSNMNPDMLLLKNIRWFCRRYQVDDTPIKNLEEIVANLDNINLWNPPLAVVKTVVRQVKSLCKKLQTKIWQEAQAFK